MKKAISIILIFSVFISLNGCARTTISRNGSRYTPEIQEKVDKGYITGGIFGGLIGLLLGIGITAAMSTGSNDATRLLWGMVLIPGSLLAGAGIGSVAGSTAGYYGAKGEENYEFVPHYPKQLNYNQELRINNLQPFLLTNYW